jgi:cystathionine beta-lyase
MPGVNMALSGNLKQGDGVVVQPPVYGPMLAAPHNWNLRSQPVPLVLQGAEWVYDTQSMQAGLSTSKALLFCNPQNPTGKVFTRPELETVAKLCREQDNLVISNESHCDLVYDGRRHVPFASLSEDTAQRTITLMSASKAYNIAGLKTAFAIVQNKALRDTFEASKLGMVDSVNAFGLVATHAAYSQADSWKTELLAYLAANRDHLTTRLSNALPMLRVIPAQGTFLAWIDCSRLGLANPHGFLLENAKVGMSNGADFGTGYEQFVRLNYGCPRSVLDAALDRLEIAVKALHLSN